MTSSLVDIFPIYGHCLTLVAAVWWKLGKRRRCSMAEEEKKALFSIIRLMLPLSRRFDGIID
jgi:hypothetical protein